MRLEEEADNYVSQPLDEGGKVEDKYSSGENKDNGVLRRAIKNSRTRRESAKYTHHHRETLRRICGHGW
ncbi:hypothetical protein AUJ84_01370 [Candidatus Pacearchaeota archaeon CG1_02_32_132]|nr:MAG: hypothetical protein AUJ84_01370 [Candidatus Pacearchaeota archaeon CG1_02_32_132]